MERTALEPALNSSLNLKVTVVSEVSKSVETGFTGAPPSTDRDVSCISISKELRVIEEEVSLTSILKSY